MQRPTCLATAQGKPPCEFPPLLNLSPTNVKRSSPGGSVVKNPPANAGDAGDISLIPALGRSPGEGHGYPLQYSCLENAMERGTWRTTVHGVAKSCTWLTHTQHNNHFSLVSPCSVYAGTDCKPTKYSCHNSTQIRTY